MKLVFLHGLGQSSDDWQDVIDELLISNILTIPLFSGISQTDSINLNILNRKVSAILDNLNEPYILCGLSLGSILVLQQAIRKKPLLKGIVVSAAQFESPSKVLLTIQNSIFYFLPRKSFQSLGITKRQVIELVNSMKHLQLKEKLNYINIPALVICGSKDRVNLSASKKLALLLRQSSFQIISGGHELNREQPKEFAKLVKDFISYQVE